MISILRIFNETLFLSGNISGAVVNNITNPSTGTIANGQWRLVRRAHYSDGETIRLIDSTSGELLITLFIMIYSVLNRL